MFSNRAFGRGPDSPDVFRLQVEIKGLDEKVFRKWRFIIISLEVKVCRVRESVDTFVCPAGDGQRDRVERPQPPYRLL